MSERARFAEVVRADRVDVGLACLLIGAEVDPDLDVAAGLAELDELAKAVKPLLHLGPAHALRLGLGVRERFRGAPEDYEDVRSSLLHEVLRRRRGLPILLSVVWCEVALRLGVPAAPLGLPGHVLTLVEDVVVDPFSGGVVVNAPREPVLDPVDLLLRVLMNVRSLTTRQPPSLESARTRLWATELSLLLPRHPVTLRRERGELMVRLGDYPGGARQLEEYAGSMDDVDEDEATKARHSAGLARARLN